MDAVPVNEISPRPEMDCGGGDCPSMEPLTHDRAEQAQSLGIWFELGKKISLQENFEFVGEDLEAQDLAKLICGMLNSGQGGKIFVGVDPDGTVKGKIMDRGYRDAIRLSLDSLNILPVLFTHALTFVPVKDGTSLMDQVFVGIISCSPMKITIFEACDSSACYYRLGKETLSLSRQEVWSLVIKEKEKAWLKTLGTTGNARVNC